MKVSQKISSWSFLLTLMVGIFIAAQAQAADIHYIWNDMTGVQPLSACSVTNAKQSLPEAFNKYLDQIVEIIDTPALLHASDDTAELQGTYLQLATKNGQFQIMNCSGLPFSFVVFDVHSAEGNNSFSQIGVAASELELFHHSQVLSPEQADTLIQSAVAPSIMEKATVTASTTEQIYCSANAQNNMYKDDLKTVAFKINASEVVQQVESWNSANKKNKTINGKPVAFVKYLVPRLKEGQNVGWVAEYLVTSPADCPYYKKPVQTIPAPTPTTPIKTSTWTFPTTKRASVSYKTGMRAFKASRGGGTRWHAACDIYRVTNEGAVAINDGTVVRGLYFFYEGTYALEVRHSDGKIGRYGEVTGKSPAGTANGAKLTTGQTVGYIGKVNSGCCEPMLHFELYSGKATGPLTQSGNKFSRRSDLIDPSTYLTDWEKLTFGVAY